MKRRWSGAWLALGAALLSGAAMLVAYALFEVAPFGDLTILHADMNSQYARFYAYLIRALRGEESLLYSFHAGLGGSMIPTITYYLASPFSLLAFFFDEAHIPEMLLVMTVLKVAAMAATYVVFARKALRDTSARVVPLSLCYSLCAYVISYASNIMWLDALILLPLVLTSVTKLARGEGGWGLILWLALLFFSQFYIGYMVGIFSFLWLLGALFVYRAPRKWRKIGKLLASAVLAAGCCAALLIPTALRLLENAGFVDAAPGPAWVFSHDVRALFLRSFFGVYDTIMGKPGSMPPLYCGTVCLLLLPVYFFNRGISLRERMVVLAGSVFLLLCVSLPPLTYVWHAFDEAAWFQYRFSFLLAFLWVFAAHRCLQYVQSANRWIFLGSGLAVALCLYLWPVDIRNTFYYVAWAVVGLLVGWTLLGFAYSFLRGRARVVCGGILSVLLIVELTANAYILLFSISQEEGVPFTTAGEYREEYSRNAEVIAALPEAEDGPYRVEYLKDNAPNEGIAYGTMSQQYYSTAAQRSLTLALHNLGFYSRGIFQSNAGRSIATDSLLGIRFLIGEDSPNAHYHPADPEITSGGLSAFENDYVFPLAFAASDQALHFSLPDRPLDYQFYSYYFQATNSFEDLNRMFRALSGEDTLDVFLPLSLDTYHTEGITVEPQEGGGVVLRKEPGYEGTPLLYYDLVADMDAPVYGMFRPVHETAGITINLDGRTVYEPQSSSGAMVIYIGQYEPGETIPLEIQLSGEEVYLDAQWLYALDLDTLWDLGGELYGTALEEVEWKATRISGRLQAQEDQILFLSVPYDGGWSAWVDGQRVTVEPALQAFLGVPVPAGDHQIELRYLPVGFLPGAVISCLSLFVCVGMLLLHINRRRQAAWLEENPSLPEEKTE